MRAAFSRPSRRTLDDEAGILPLINVILLLLVFFLAAGQLKAPEPLRVQVPQADLEATTLTSVPTITVGQDGSLTLDGAAVVEAVLLHRITADGDRHLTLRADHRAAAAQVVSLAARLRAAGVETLDLVVVKR